MVANIGLWDKKDPRFVVRGSYFVSDIDENNKKEHVILTTDSHLVIYKEGVSGYRSYSDFWCMARV